MILKSQIINPAGLPPDSLVLLGKWLNKLEKGFSVVMEKIMSRVPKNQRNSWLAGKARGRDATWQPLLLGPQRRVASLLAGMKTQQGWREGVSSPPSPGLGQQAQRAPGQCSLRKG